MLRNLFVHAASAVPVDLRGRRIVVTGASPGSIGHATARILASWGAAVAISARGNAGAIASDLNAQAGAAHPAPVRGHDLDLCDAASVARFADWVGNTFDGRLDVLVNNAGIHLDLRSQWTAPRLVDGEEIHWRTNYLGTMDLTHRLVPLLCASGRQTGDARIVNVVSMLHARGSNEGLFAPLQPYDSWVAYGTSKLALVHATRELQGRLAASQVRACCLHPGAVYSRIADKGLEGSPAIAAIRRFLAPVEAFFLLDIEEGAQTSVHCATSAAMKGGAYYRNCAEAAPSPLALDAGVSGRLWNRTLDRLRGGNAKPPGPVQALDPVT